jgi:YrbI family 3-deoxy-D-manno-octulosonate 8-phosphate phosphatase
MTQKTIAFIPVRGGSKSIPLKNIKDFCGKPLVYWSILALENCDLVNEIIIATDSDEIENVVLSFGFKKAKVYRRQAENANDTASSESVMFEYIEATPSLAPTDVFVLVQATSPLTETTHFTEALSRYQSEKVDSMLSSVRIKRFFWNANGTPQNYDFYNRPRRQDFEGDLMENGAFYIHTVGGIMKHRCRLGDKVGVYEMPEHTAVELDEPHDWLVAEAVMRKNQSWVLGHELSILESFQESRPKTRHSRSKIKLFLTDVDGVLTDGSMYYSENGDELKRFHTYDGMAFEMLRKAGIKTGIITSENTEIVARRAAKLKVDYLFQGKRDGGKLAAAQYMCQELDINLSEVAYIGDDINCLELLQNVGVSACPANAMAAVKNIFNIIQLQKKGGEGVVREFVELILR